jgi:hypothetical protein
MPKHNKKRNTAFLYEILVREVVRCTVSKNKERRDKTIMILKEHFVNHNEMGKELNLYKTLLETKNLPTRTADKLIHEAKQEYKKLNKKTIFQEQSELIKKINKNLSKSVFGNFVPNYKDLATLSQLFGDDVTLKRRIMLEESLLKRIVSKDIREKKKDIRISGLVVNKFVEKFNKEYSENLLENQKTLLNKFILSFLDNGIDFKLYLNEEIGILKKKIKNAFTMQELQEDTLMTSKMKEIQTLLETANRKPIDKRLVQQILKIQTLAKEIEN